MCIPNHKYYLFFQHKIAEKADKFAPDWKPNTLSHSNLILLLEKHNVIADEIISEMDNIQGVEFRDQVKHFLKLIKILCIG